MLKHVAIPILFFVLVITASAVDARQKTFYAVAAQTYVSELVDSHSLYADTIYVKDFVALIVDRSATFTHCTLVMGSGSSIVVNSGISVTVTHNTLLYSCPQMWQGITLQPAAKLMMEGSTLKDAQTGIMAQNGSRFDIVNSRIVDCVTGIETASTGLMGQTTGTVTGTEFGLVNLALKGEYNTQPQHGSVGRAGMLINDLAAITIGNYNMNENLFHDLNFGIEIHNSNVDVVNCRFEKMTTDYVYAQQPYLVQAPFGAALTARRTNDFKYNLNVSPLTNGGTTIDNANYGIYTNFYSATIKGISMKNVDVGTKSEESHSKCSVVVMQCNIEAFYKGIDWVDNDGASLMRAEDNTIVVERKNQYSKGGMCISMNEFVQGNNANYQIVNNNHLETKGTATGIFARGVENASVKDNLIFTNLSQQPTSGASGMVFENGSMNSVSCNAVTNTIPHSNIKTVGLFVSMSTNNKINCNNFGTNLVQGSTGSYRGMSFAGECDVFNDVAGNVMTECVEGLYLNNVSRIGQQIHRGNVWSNPTIGNTTAINQNVFNSNYLNSRIRYNPNSGTAYYPNTISPPLWFDPDISTSDFTSCGTQVCNTAITGGGGDEEHLKQVALDSAISFDYRDENLNQAQSNLYALLQEDSLLRASDSVFQNFYGNKQTVAIGQLQAVKESMSAANRFTPMQEATLALADSLIKIMTDSIAVLDSLYATDSISGYSTLRENLITTLNTLNVTVATLLQQHDAMADSTFNAAALKNSAVLPAQLPEINHKQMNEMILQYKENGQGSISSNFAALFAIAQQCPYSGGPAVYQARALLEKINDTLEYYDDAICLQSGIYRLMTTDVNSIAVAYDYKLIPNPASQQVTVALNFTNEEAVHFEIRNVLGAKINEFAIDKGIKSIVISVNNYDQGIYFIRMRKDGLTLNTKKLIVIQ